MAVPNVGTIAATTLKNYRGTLADNLTTHSIILRVLREYGFVREEEGGTEIVETLMYGSNTTVKPYYRYEPFDLTPQEGIDQAQFPWKQIGGTVSIAGLDEFMNSGKAKIIKLLEAKMTQLDISFRERVNEMILSDGTGYDGKEITGLQAAVEEGTAWSVYGGIDSDIHTWWRNYFLNFTGAGYTSFGTTSGASVEGMDVLRLAYNTLMRNTEVPGLILTTPEIYAAYEAYGEGAKTTININAKSDRKVLDLGYDNIKYRHVPVVFDDDIPAGYMWLLNPQYLKFVIGKGRNFKVGEFQEPQDQEAKSAKVILYAQLTVSNRARQGLITNIAV